SSVRAEINPPAVPGPARTHVIRRSAGQAAHWTPIRADDVNVGIARLGTVEGNPVTVRRPSRAPQLGAVGRSQLHGVAALAVADPDFVAARAGRGESDLVAAGRELRLLIRLRGVAEPGWCAFPV